MKDAEREAKEDAKRLSERDKDNGKKADAREAKEDTKKAVKDEPNEAGCCPDFCVCFILGPQAHRNTKTVARRGKTMHALHSCY